MDIPLTKPCATALHRQHTTEILMYALIQTVYERRTNTNGNSKRQQTQHAVFLRARSQRLSWRLTHPTINKCFTFRVPRGRGKRLTCYDLLWNMMHRLSLLCLDLLVEKGNLPQVTECFALLCIASFLDFASLPFVRR